MDLGGTTQLWLLFSLLSAFFHASRLAVTKHLSLNLSVPVLTLYVNLASLLVTLPLALWHHQVPWQDPVYLSAVLAGGLLSGLGGFALTTAIARSEVSLVGPVMTLTPGFAVLIEWLLTAALPGPLGLAGLALLLLGSYVISIDSSETTWLRPLRRLFSDPGGRYTLLAALSFAAAAIFGRIGIQRSDPLSFAVVVALVNPLLLFLLFSLRDPHFYRALHPAALRGQGRALLLLGLLFALMRIADQLALSLTLASYAMAVKRSAGMFAVVLGRFWFHEGNTQTKLAGSAIMLLGLFVLLQQ